MSPAEILKHLLALHDAIGGAWSIESRNGGGFYQEVIIAAKTVEDQNRLAAEFGIKLERVLSVNGANWWFEGLRLIEGIRVRITGPHFAVAEQAVQP